MWISIVVPVAVLLAALLLQRLEAALLKAPEPAEHPTDPVVAPLTLVPPAEPVTRHVPSGPAARATA